MTQRHEKDGGLSVYEAEQLKATLDNLRPLVALARENFPSTNTGIVIETSGADPHARISVSATGAEALIKAADALLAERDK